MAKIALPPGLGPAGRPRSVLSDILLPASWVYGAAAMARRRFLSRRAVRLGRPVISIGNITCGGTGKTPTVEMAVRDLLGMGRRPAILSRGYGPRFARAPCGPLAPRQPAARTTDESLVLAANLPQVPQYLGKDRVLSGREAIENGADVLVLDDGFHYRKVSRDLDLVLIDAILPFGNDRVLPAGLLREPLGALAEADLFGITRSDLVSAGELASVEDRLEKLFPRTPRILLKSEVVECRSLGGEVRPPEFLRGQKVLAFCGIGNPESFLRLLCSLGAAVAELVRFRDHHRYSPADLERLRALERKLGADAVAFTQKDAVKIAAAPENWFCVRIAQRIARGEELYRAALQRALSRDARAR